MATAKQVEEIRQLFLDGRLECFFIKSIENLSAENARQVIATALQTEAGTYKPIDEHTRGEILKLIDAGRLPMLKEADLDGLSTQYAKGILWIAGEDSSNETTITSKQRTRIRKMIANGLLPKMADSEISRLSLHEAEVLIKRCSSEYFRKRDAKNRNRKPGS